MCNKLHAKQLKAARMMAYGRSCREISLQLNLNAHTLSRWKKIPEFIKEYEKVLKEQQQDLYYRMTHLAAASVEVLWSELHGDPASSQRVKVALNLIKPFIQLIVPDEKQPETCEFTVRPMEMMSIRRL